MSGTAAVDVITFSVTGTIMLGSELPIIPDPLKIDGPAAPGLTISGTTACAFSVSPPGRRLT